jgi:hypothetical protein
MLTGASSAGFRFMLCPRPATFCTVRAFDPNFSNRLASYHVLYIGG